MSETNGITWWNISRLEPALQGLLLEAQAVVDPGGPAFCAADAWRERFHDRLTPLAGTFASCRHFLLVDAEAYDLAARVIREALPACRDCGCEGVGHA